MKKMGKRIISLVLTVAMLASMALSVSAAKLSEFIDYPGDGYWANEALQTALDNGLLYGKGEGIIDSEANLTRAEMAAIIVRAFGATKADDISKYTDIGADMWYYGEFAKAVRMGVFVGDGTGKMRPDDSITREEAFTVFARAMVLTETDYSPLSKFNDVSNISEWAKEYLSPLVRRGYINGDTLGNINPKNNITRAEFAQFMHNMFKKYYSASGDYSTVGTDSALIRAENINISNITVEDDLVIGDGANEGLITISNVHIGGRLLVRGAATVRLTNVTTGGGVVVKNVNNTVHFDNYETEAVFTGIQKLTHATFKQQAPTGGGTGGGGGGSDTEEYDYKIEYYKQKTDLSDYEIVAEDTVEDTGRAGTTKTAPDKDYEGFTLNEALSIKSGKIKSDGSLVLKMYYDLETVDVIFMNRRDEVKTEKAAKGYTLPESKMPSESEASRSEEGFVIDGTVSGVYDPEEYDQHVINYEWWYNAGTDEDPDWQLFLPEIKDDEDNVTQEGSVLTKDTVVYLATQQINLGAYVDAYGRTVTIAQKYASTTRFLDTIKDLIYNREPLTAMQVAGIEEKSFQKLREFNVIDDDNNILIQNILVRYSMIIDDMEEFVREAAEDLFEDDEELQSSLPEFIAVELNGTHLEKSKLDEMLYALMDYTGLDTVKQELENSGITLPASVTKEELLSVVYANSSNQGMLEAISEHFADYLKTHNSYREYVVNQIIDKQYGETFATLVNQLENDERFNVTADTKFIIRGLLNKMDSFGYESIKAKIPEKLFLIYPEEKVVEIYDGAFNTVRTEAENALEALENGTLTSVSCATGITFVINPVSDVYAPLYDSLTELIENKVGTNYYYENNKYLQGIIELFEYTNLFDASSTESGYKLKTLDDYYTILTNAVILADDALVWYHENLDMEKVNQLADDYQELVLKYVNIVVDAAQAYIDNGDLPDGVDNDNVRAIETKVLELLDSKFPGLVDKLVNWYEESPFNREYTEVEYTKVKDSVNFIINNANITTNEVFDDVLPDKFADKKVDVDKYKQEIKNNWIQIERIFFK